MTNYREQQRAGGYVRDPAQPAEDAPYPHDELATLRAQVAELRAALEQIEQANHPDYPYFKSGTEAEFADHLIAVARAALAKART